MNVKKETLFENMNKDYFRDAMKTWNLVRRWFHTTRNLESYRQVMLAYKKCDKIVDLGCGTCEWNFDKLNVVGVDSNVGFLESAKQAGNISHYFVSDVDSTKMPDEFADIVTLFEVIEHIIDYNKVILEAKRILKDDGYCIVSVPYDVPLSLWRPLFFIRVMLQGYIFGDRLYKNWCGHVNHFSPETIKSPFIRNGFSVESCFVKDYMTIFCIFKKIVEERK
jgi:ubiquinone/menaquinone biosynthesis C-methylase UbiE